MLSEGNSATALNIVAQSLTLKYCRLCLILHPLMCGIICSKSEPRQLLNLHVVDYKQAESSFLSLIILQRQHYQRRTPMCILGLLYCASEKTQIPNAFS